MIGVSAFSQLVTLQPKQPWDRCSSNNTGKHKIRLIAYNVKHLVSSSYIDTVIGVSAFSRIATLHSKQPRGRSGTSNTEQHKSGLIAFNVKHSPHSTTLPSTPYAVTTRPLSYPIFESSPFPSSLTAANILTAIKTSWACIRLWRLLYKC